MGPRVEWWIHQLGEGAVGGGFGGGLGGGGCTPLIAEWNPRTKGVEHLGKIHTNVHALSENRGCGLALIVQVLGKQTNRGVFWSWGSPCIILYYLRAKFYCTLLPRRLLRKYSISFRRLQEVVYNSATQTLFSFQLNLLGMFGDAVPDILFCIINTLYFFLPRICGVV